MTLITNIQKYSIHDGTGIRTSVFFKGCPLHCQWCHNPETQSYEQGLILHQERCTGCGACAAHCEAGAIRISDGKAVTDREKCRVCQTCIDWCVNSVRELCGEYWEIQDLVQEILKDMAFYEQSGGGVTLSGGEVLAQDPKYLEALLKKLARFGVRVNIDTCGAVPYERFARVLPYTDVFLYDFKLLDEEKHRQYTGAGNALILENLERLARDGARIWVRIPVIGGVNDSPQEIAAIGEWLRDHRIHPQQVNLLPYHNTGSSKYPNIGRVYEGELFSVPDNEKMEALKLIMEEKTHVPVKIGG